MDMIYKYKSGFECVIDRIQILRKTDNFDEEAKISLFLEIEKFVEYVNSCKYKHEVFDCIILISQLIDDPSNDPDIYIQTKQIKTIWCNANKTAVRCLEKHVKTVPFSHLDVKMNVKYLINWLNHECEQQLPEYIEEYDSMSDNPSIDGDEMIPITRNEHKTELALFIENMQSSVVK